MTYTSIVLSNKLSAKLTKQWPVIYCLLTYLFGAQDDMSNRWCISFNYKHFQELTPNENGKDPEEEETTQGFCFQDS